MLADNDYHKLLTKKSVNDFYIGHQETFVDLDPEKREDRIRFRKFILEGMEKAHARASEGCVDVRFREPHERSQGKRLTYAHPEFGAIEFTARSFEHPHGGCTVTINFRLLQYA